jgi:5-formyltetrahydrofolate cyclo-ligase
VTAPPAADAPKEEWRAWARAERSAYDWEAISKAVAGAFLEWPPLLAASTVLGFMPMQGEIDLHAVLEADLSARKAVTRTPEHGGLTIHELRGPFEVHRWGFLQPHASAPVIASEEIDVWLVPDLAFDLHGNRLGNGAGYFDGLLAGARKGAFLVGVVPVALVADRLPSEAHDVPMGYLATEEGIVEVAR